MTLPAPPAAHTVLVVEDDEAVRDMLCDFLVLHGFRARGCRGGEEAVELSCGTCFDAVIIDHFLPQGTGTETTRELRRLCPSSVIIGISGSHDGAGFAEAGGNLFLQKPVNVVLLERYLRGRLS